MGVAVRRFLFLFALLSAGHALADPAEDDAQNLASGRRLCSQNMLTLDVPVAARLLKDFNTVSRHVLEGLKAQVEGAPHAISWLGSCPDGLSPRMQIVDLMAAVPAAARRGCVDSRDTECKRHQRIEFWCGADEETPLPITHLCEALQAVRGDFARKNPAYQKQSALYIARDCAARSQGWPETFVGAPPPAPPVETRVVVLERSGTPHAEKVTRLLATFATPRFWPTGSARIELDRLFDIEGTPISRVAEALAVVLREDGREASRTPLVVNISLGWPPEFGRTWGAGACLESPAGESVRYALRLLAERPRTIVLAAAGNRQLVVPATSLQFEPEDRCKPGKCELFFPAAWARLVTQPSWARRPIQSVLAVGQAGPDGPPDTYRYLAPSFYAPGRLLDIEGDADFGSGTSYATALASSLAARALAEGSIRRLTDLLRVHTCVSKPTRSRLRRPGPAWPRRADLWLRWEGRGRRCPVGMTERIPGAAAATVAPELCPLGPGCPVEPGTLEPSLPDSYHRTLSALPQPITPICPEPNCLATVDTSAYATVDFAGTLDTAISASPTEPFVVSGTPKLKLFKGTSLVATWTLTASTWTGTVTIGSLSIPSGHRNASDWQNGQYQFKLESKHKEGGSEYYHLDPMHLVLTP